VRLCIVTITILTSLTALSVSADPLPAPEPENGFSVMQTFETTFHHERPISGDTLGTSIIYAGPSLARVWLPEEVTGNGMGIEIGVEARRYVIRPLSGPFVGLYIGGGVLWRHEAEKLESISTGLKLGWRIKLLEGMPNLDLEPYIGVGFRIFGNDPYEISYGYLDGKDHFQGIIYLGTKVDIF